MSAAWGDVALYGTAAAVGMLSGLPTGEAANCLKVLLDGRAPNFRGLVAKAEKALGQHIAQDHRGEAGFAPIRAAVEQMLRDFGWSPAFAVEADLDPDRIAKRIVDAGHGLLVFDPHEREEPGAAAVRERRRLAEALIACVYRAILADGRQLNEVLPEALSALLKLRGEVARLPAATAEALLDLQTRLLLTPGTRVLTERQPQDSWLLRPDYAVVPFDPARQADLDELLAWCGDGPPRAVRLLHGPGGFGKSRLLIEATRALRGQGWHAGFLARGDTIPPAGTYERLCAGERPVLIAIDYAETGRGGGARAPPRARRHGPCPARRPPRPCRRRLVARAQARRPGRAGAAGCLCRRARFAPGRRRSGHAPRHFRDGGRGLRRTPGPGRRSTRSTRPQRQGLWPLPLRPSRRACRRAGRAARARRPAAGLGAGPRAAGLAAGPGGRGAAASRQHEALVAQGAALATLAGSVRGEPELEALLATPRSPAAWSLRLRAARGPAGAALPRRERAARSAPTSW